MILCKMIPTIMLKCKMTATMFYAYDMEVEIGYNPTIRYHDKYVHTLCKQF